MNFEKKIIDPILALIRKHQDYLCKDENLPQSTFVKKFYYTKKKNKLQI